MIYRGKIAGALAIIQEREARAIHRATEKPPKKPRHQLEAPDRQRIAELRAKGYSVPDISKRLKKEGRSFSPTTIYRALDHHEEVTA